MNATDVFLLHTDKQGNAYAASHRVWDKDLFLQTEADAARKEGGQVFALTEAEYQKARQ